MPRPSNQDARCRDLLRRAPLFSKLSDVGLQDLLQLFRWETIEKQQVIDTPDKACARIRIIVAGRVKLSRCNPETGREISLFLLGPGDVHDVSCLFEPGCHDFLATPLDRLETLSAPLGDFRRWLTRHPEFYSALHSYMCHRMGHLADLAADLSLHSTETRLAKLILRHLDPGADQPPLRLIQDLPHEELASLIGSVRVVVNRHLQEFKHLGILTARRGRLEVHDGNALARQAMESVGVVQ